MADWGGTVTFEERSYYNVTDFNRENTNIQYLRDKLASFGYVVTLPQPITILARTNYPTPIYINRVKNNISALLVGIGLVPSVVVNTARKQIFDYTGANSLELDIQLVYDGFELITQSWKYCGTFSCGEGGSL